MISQNAFMGDVIRHPSVVIRHIEFAKRDAPKDFEPSSLPQSMSCHNSLVLFICFLIYIWLIQSQKKNKNSGVAMFFRPAALTDDG